MADVQLRIADTITTFAGSMPFVYFHAVVFACWMLFVEPAPWPKLTLIVSLEAIFLSTFVMIGQNRQSEFQRAKADHDFTSEAQEFSPVVAWMTRTSRSTMSMMKGVAWRWRPTPMWYVLSHGSLVLTARAAELRDNMSLLQASYLGEGNGSATTDRRSP